MEELRKILKTPIRTASLWSTFFPSGLFCETLHIWNTHHQWHMNEYEYGTFVELHSQR